MNGEKSKINKLQITAVVIAAAALLTVVVVRTGKTSETGSEKPVSSDISSAASDGKIYFPQMIFPMASPFMITSPETERLCSTYLSRLPTARSEVR